MSSRSLYMPLYISDYLADTAHLTTLEHGAYLLLIMNYWQRGKPLPNNDAKLSKICKLKVQKFLKMKPILSELFSVSDSEWRHKRIDKEIEISQEKSDKRRLAAHSRWKDSGKTEDANAMQMQCKSNANAMHMQCYNEYNEMNSMKEYKKEKLKKEKSLDDFSSEVSDETSAFDSEKKSIDKNQKTSNIAEVFSHWQNVHGKPKAKLDEKRRRLIDKALRGGYSVEQLKQAIDGCKKSRFHYGQNESNTIYNDLGLILRDAAKIEMFIGFNEGSQTSTINFREQQRQDYLAKVIEEFASDGDIRTVEGEDVQGAEE